MKRYVFNPTDLVMIVGGLMIPPGDGRDVDTTLLPPEPDDPQAEGQPQAEPTAEAAAREALLQMLSGSVAAVREQLPTLSDETLAALAALEGEAERPRRTLLEAIAATQLDRARQRTAEGGAAGGAAGKGGEGSGSTDSDPPPAG